MIKNNNTKLTLKVAFIVVLDESIASGFSGFLVHDYFDISDAPESLKGLAKGAFICGKRLEKRDMRDLRTYQVRNEKSAVRITFDVGIVVGIPYRKVSKSKGSASFFITRDIQR